MRTTYDKGLVAVVLDAYGWHDNPTDAQLLERLVSLNSERRAEEAQGYIRWLRPEFQAPGAAVGGWAVAGVAFIQSSGQEYNMGATERITELLQTLPEREVAEVLDFADGLYDHRP